MDGYALLKETVLLSEDICYGCKIGGPTFKMLPGFLAQMEAEAAARELEIESLKLQNSFLLRRLDPQTTFELINDEGVSS